MSKAYLEELASTETADGLLLDGAVIRPSGTQVKPLAVVWTHGFTGKFYEPFILHIGRELAGYGYTLVTGHNRGHHCGATAVMKPRSRRRWPPGSTRYSDGFRARTDPRSLLAPQ